jgi:rod shape-determining protein MreD
MTGMPYRLLVAAESIVAALVLQTTILSRLPLPGGTPSLLLVFVVACALVGGVPAGVGVGFTTGLAADLISNHPVGLLALIFLLVGWLVGLIETDGTHLLLRAIVAVAVSAVGSFALYVALLALIGSDRVQWSSQLADLPTTVLYDVVLTPLVVPLVAAVERRLRTAGYR